AGIHVDWEVVAGPPAVSIEETAASIHVDLVVLGTHGREGVARVLMGSVAERDLRIAHRPILIARAPTSGDGATGSLPAGARGRRALAAERTAPGAGPRATAGRGCDGAKAQDPSSRSVAHSPTRPLAEGVRHILCPVNYSEVAHTAFE